MTIQVFAKFLNAMMRIPFCSTLLNWHSFRMDLLIIDFFFFEYSFQSKLVQFLFYFYLLVEQICSYFFLFVFLVSFSIFLFFFCQIYRLCSSSFNVGFFVKRKAMCVAMFFWVMHSHISFLGTWSRCVRELQNNSLEQQSDMTLCGVGTFSHFSWKPDRKKIICIHMPSSLEQKKIVRACAHQTQGMHRIKLGGGERDWEAMYKLKLARDKPGIEQHICWLVPEPRSSCGRPVFSAKRNSAFSGTSIFTGKKN